MDWYANALVKAMNMEIDLDDNMTWTLHTSSYTPDRVAHDYVNDLTNELATAGGYTVGGISAGAVSRTLTAANSWATARANGATYAVGDVVRPATPNGFLYRAVVGGVAGGSIPTFPTTVGADVADGAVTWECYGIAIIVFLAANQPSWATFTATGIRYLVLSDRTAGAAAAQPLIAITDFVTDRSGGGGTWAVSPHPTLGNFHHIVR